ncbi:hypothetical protein [Actinoplanes sp. NPDC020271]|uniref:hypothetical protein n=1 Tax=Actinoplanes sp. NPDC020271 TaxID=3363896 RepID=UPI003788515A
MSERAVRHAFREAVETYCNLLTASGRDSRGLRVRVTVTTVRTLSPETVRWIHLAAQDHVRNLLPGAEVQSIEFPVRPSLESPGHRFGFRSTGPGPCAASGVDDVTEEHEAGAVAVLTLRYDRSFVWPCRIGAAAGWLAVGRQPGPGQLPLPSWAAWLPRGPLLLVRNHRGRLDFGRSGQRPRYRIRVDGVDLHPGGPVGAASAGEIHYHDQDQVTVLRYRVDWEGNHA